MGLLIGIVLIIMAATQFIFLFQFQTITRKRAERYAESLVNQVADQLYSHVRNTEQGGSVIANNRYVQEYFVTDDAERKYILLFPFVSDVLEYVRSSNENIYDIIFTGTDGRIVTSLRNAYAYQHDIQNILIQDYSINSAESKKPVHTALLQNIDGANYYAYIVPIFSINPGIKFLEKTGSCIIVSNTESMERLITDIQLSENSGFGILDRDNTIMASNKNAEHGKNFESLYNITLTDYQKKTLVQYRLLTNTGWKVVSLIPEKELSADMRSIRRFGLFLGILMIVALGVSAAALIRNTNQLLKTQKQYHETELLKKEAELSALQNQINPHFLYNTLNCISSIALVNDINEIVSISEAMVRIFRYGLKQSDFVNIRDEIALIRDYMEIMNIRYPGRFILKISLNEQILKLKTIKMILQPLVENAVYHGLETKNGPGELAISGRMVSGSVFNICIEDNGKGMEESELMEIQNALKMETSREETGVKRGIGLININRRIQLMFGREYGLSMESRENSGTRIFILLPVINS